MNTAGSRGRALHTSSVTKVVLNLLLLLLLLLLLCTPLGESWAAEPAPLPLVIERTIPLTGVSGRIDHLAIDLGRKRLWVAELGNGTVDAIDLVTGKTVHRIGGLREPQGIGYAPKADLIAVTSAGDGSVRLFHAQDFLPQGTIHLGNDADNIRLDSKSGQLVVGYGSGGLAVLDPASRSITSRTKLLAHPEGFQLDQPAHRAFVNVPEAREIAVVDLGTGKQIAIWRVPNLRANFPMALNEAGSVVATVFRSPARLVGLDTKSGAVKANLETCHDADDVFFNSRRQRIYVSCGEGAVDVFQHDASGYRRLSRNQNGARCPNLTVRAGNGSALRCGPGRVVWARFGRSDTGLPGPALTRTDYMLSWPR